MHHLFTGRSIPLACRHGSGIFTCSSLRCFSTQDKLQGRQLTLEECKSQLNAHLFEPSSLGLPSDFLLTSFASMKG